MRVDEDVCITRFPIAALHTALASSDYAFGLETSESHRETLETFTPWVHEYLESTALRPTIPPLPTGLIYFTNFFVSRVKWWDRLEVRHFLGAVDASGG
eukprot:4419723-Prymnesium_polylepis.3